MGISDNETIHSTSNFDRSNNASLIDANFQQDQLEVINIPVQISEHSLVEGARQVLDVLRPSWESANIKFKLFTDGITNKLVGCYHRPSSPHQSDDKLSEVAADVVLIRIYGNKTDLLIDRAAEARNIQLLQRHGFAPSLYGIFLNGLAYEYVPGVTLTAASVVAPAVWPLVARRMAEMHRLDVRWSDSKESPEPVLWAKTQQFLNLVPERFSDAAKHQRITELGLPSVQQLRDGFAKLYAHLKTLGSPVVFAHNDLLLGNVIYTESCERVSFIDYEYADHNYQAFDIGNHFTEFAGLDEIDYSRYPSKEFQHAWLRTYLETFTGKDAVSDKEIHRLYAQVNAFALASHYFWTIWALIQTEHSTIAFDFIAFAQIRYTEFLAKQETFLTLSLE